MSLAPLYGSDFRPTWLPFASKAFTKTSVDGINGDSQAMGSNQISFWPAALLLLAFPTNVPSGEIPVPVGTAQISTFPRWDPRTTMFGRLMAMARSSVRFRGCALVGPAANVTNRRTSTFCIKECYYGLLTKPTIIVSETSILRSEHPVPVEP